MEFLQKSVFLVKRWSREAKEVALRCEVVVEAGVVSRMHAAFSDRVDISKDSRPLTRN